MAELTSIKKMITAEKKNMTELNTKLKQLFRKGDKYILISTSAPTKKVGNINTRFWLVGGAWACHTLSNNPYVYFIGSGINHKGFSECEFNSKWIKWING